MKSIRALCFLLMGSFACPGQGTTRWTATFVGWPSIDPGSIIRYTYYEEYDLIFTGIGGGHYSRSGGVTLAGFPQNRGPYLMGGLGASLSVSCFTGRPFTPVSVDLAEWSTLYQIPLAVEFVGYRPDGSTVVTEFVTDGIIDGAGPLNDFETFNFDARFMGITRLEIVTIGWNLDNFVYSSVIPEPSGAALLLCGGALAWRWSRRPPIGGRRSRS